MGGKGSLARRLLALQLLIVVVLLGAVTAVSLAQARDGFRRAESRRMLGIAEDVAANPSMRDLLADPAFHTALAPFAESARSLSGASFVIIARTDLVVLTSPDPRQVGHPVPIGPSPVRSGRSWTGEVDRAVVAHVPVIGRDGSMIGIVAAGQVLPSAWTMLADSPEHLLALLGLATALGTAGSLWLSWWVKRQTHGLEPREIAVLVEHRGAMLHGIKEGVLGMDRQHRVTLVNDHARELLSLPDDAVGRAVDDLGLNDRLVDVLTGRAAGSDQIGLRRGKVLNLNRMPVSARGRLIGAVVTLRDRTELVALQRELDTTRNATDTLRAQAHEFTNRLHTIGGLIELGEYDEARRYVEGVSQARYQWHAEVTSRITDPAVAALLIAKASLAAEQNAGFRLSPNSRLGTLEDQLSADLVTVLGNLVDNALEALRGSDRPGRIEVDLVQDDEEIRVVVKDSGPGVAPALAQEVFRNGFTTKAAEQGGQRGLGLALTRQTCVRRGGTVGVHNAQGAVFTAVLPVSPRVPA